MPLFSRYSGPPLMEQVCSVENLTSAWRRVEQNIRVMLRAKSAGPDAVTLRDFAADWPNQMARLADELRNGHYRSLPPRRVAIPKASGGERVIAILAVRDRIAQRAVQQVLEPLFDPFFLDCSTGCRPRVGVPQALAQVERYAAQGRVWVVDADIASYFDTLDQRILLGLVRQRVDEVAILRLIADWLKTGALHTGETAPIDPVAPSLVRRGGQMLRGLLPAAPEPVSLPLPTWETGDPYAAAQWAAHDLPLVNPPGAWMGVESPLGISARNYALEQRLMTALMLLKPVVAGAQQVWPYVQLMGGARLALAGAVAAGAVAAGEVVSRSYGGARGTPQGGALSPLLANIYLHPFDVALTTQGLRLVRFVDDFVIMCTSADEAARALDLARRQLETLRLTLNADKTRIVNYNEGLEFLGQALVPRRSEPRRFAGVTSFEDAEQRLRATAQAVRQHFRKEEKGDAEA